MRNTDWQQEPTKMPCKQMNFIRIIIVEEVLMSCYVWGDLWGVDFKWGVKEWEWIFEL